MGSLQLKILCTLGLVMIYTVAEVRGQKSLQDLEKSLTSKIENLQRVVRGQGEEIKRQGERIRQLETEVVKLNETNQILTEKISSLEKSSETAQPVVSASAMLFQKTPRTCNELRTLNPLAQSGLYSIDPDGPNNGGEPVQVYCNTTTGTTEVGHDTENPTEVSRCSSPGCFSKTVTYNASITQMAALINLSKTCKQFIQIDCVTAPLEFRNKNYAWWNDRHGIARYAWAGDNATLEHTCECGLRNNCSEPSLKCNCDSFAPELQTDQGYVTDMSSLPVTQLNFGRNKYSTSRVTYTLGRLECSGIHQLKDEPSSCEDLWRSGNALSGIFLLQTNDSLNAVYCDFSKIPGESGFQKDIATLLTQKFLVLFQAYREGAAFIAETILDFENIEVNLGNAFDSTTFKAPVAGFYYFKFKGRIYNHSGEPIRLLKNGKEALEVKQFVNPREEFRVFTNLNAGDEITVYLAEGQLQQGSIGETQFSGMLLYPQLLSLV